MHAAYLLGTVIVLALVAADWIAFRRRNQAALGYGLAVSRQREILRLPRERFTERGEVELPRGVARLYPDRNAVVLLPDWKKFGLRFRSAWPLNGVVYFTGLNAATPVTLVKRTPWSSALLTALWFLVVVIGLLAYLVSYARAGGFSSAGGAFLGVALSGVGLLVLLFGAVVVVAAYRLENKRLMEVYEEFRVALTDSIQR
jgi:TM2 domain-containing membrane protein YozV